MIYWIWFLANGLISLFVTIRMWPVRVYAAEGSLANFGISFGFLPALFILGVSTLGALVFMVVPTRLLRGIMYAVLFVGSMAVALLAQHTITGPIACLPYSVIAIGIWFVSITLYKNSEYYDPYREKTNAWNR